MEKRLKKKPVVYAVVLTYDGEKNLEYSLPTVLAQDYPGLKLVVVDNGSGPQVGEFLSKNYPRASVVRSEKNLGYAGGNNVGIMYALRHGADYVLILNDDIKLKRGYASAIVRAGEKSPRAGVFGCRIYYMGTATLQVAGGCPKGKCDTTDANFMGKGEADEGQYDKPIELDCIYETAFGVKREVFDKIGLLDPAWFLILEGPDFCKRARKAGFTIRYVPDARLEHAVSSTTNRKKNKRLSGFMFVRHTLHASKNRLRLLLKHEGIASALRAAVGSFEYSLSNFIRYPHLVPLTFFAVGWNLLHLSRTLAIRNAGRENYEPLYEEILAKARGPS